MGKKDFLSSLAQEVEDNKAGRASSNKVMSFDEYSQKAPKVERSDDFGDIGTIKTSRVSEPVVEEAVEPIRVEEPVRPKRVNQQEAFVDEGKPKSFGGETFERVEKPKVSVDGKIIGLLAALLIVLGVGCYFFFFSSKLVMPEFTGKTMNDVNAWVKQNKIDTSVIVVNRECDFDTEKDIILSQLPDAGKKVKTDTPMTFVVSNGADPDEPISFPDINSMTYDELKSWISENKLTKTKISNEYSTTVPAGEVIKYSLKNVEESDFTRSSTLNITCSKGVAPAGQVTVEKFENQPFASVETWAKSKKVEINKVESFDQSVVAGNVISQSPASGSALKQGEVLTVVVSKGKGVVIPNLVGFTEEELKAWQSGKDNNVIVVSQSKYDKSLAGTVLGQSIEPGSVVEQGTVLMIDVSLYMPILETNSRAWLGKDYLELNAWCDGVNAKGADIQAGAYGGYECSDEYPTPGQIIDYWCEGSLSGTDEANACGRPLTLKARIGYKVSTGGCSVHTQGVVDTIVFSDYYADPANLQAFTAVANNNRIKLTPIGTCAGTQLELYFTNEAGELIPISTGYVLCSDQQYYYKTPEGAGPVTGEGGETVTP